MTATRVESLADQLHGRVTYELDDGRRFCADERHVRDLGLAQILRNLGLDAHVPTERTALFQGGRKVGTMPPGFDPLSIKSTNFFYDPRPGDFRLTDDGWVAANNLGPGDLEAIPGFVWDRDSDGTATAAANGDLPVPQDCQARAEGIAKGSSQ